MSDTRLILYICLVVALAIIAEHYFPWSMIFGKKLHRLLAYGLGVVTILIPASVMYLMWPYWDSRTIVVSLWLIAGTAGLMTTLCHAFDKLLLSIVSGREAMKREKLLRKQL